jgi:hypothetical protein
MISISVDSKDVTKSLWLLANREIPSAMRNAINDTARAVQGDIRKGMGKRFSFTSSGRRLFNWAVYFGKDKRATKERWEAIIELKDPSVNWGRPKMVEGFERATPRTPVRGKYVAAPMPFLKTGKGGHIIDTYAMRNLKPWRKLNDNAYAGQHRTLMLKGKTGKWVVVQDNSSIGRARNDLLYVLVPRVRLPGLVQFVKTGVPAVKPAWDVAASKAVVHAIKRAGTR